MTAVELINLSPSTPLNGEVPNSFWTSKEASYGHLKVFRCKVIVHIPKNERSKLDGKTKQCIFLATAETSLGTNCGIQFLRRLSKVEM